MATITPVELLLWIGCTLFLFLVGRFVIIWYYKIDERIILQKETNTLLQKISQQLSQPKPPTKSAKVKALSTPIESDVNNPEYFNNLVDKLKEE